MKTVTFIPEIAAEEIQPDNENCLLISITHPEDAAAKVWHWPNVIRFAFDDVEYGHTNNSFSVFCESENPYVIFNEEMAKEIIFNAKQFNDIYVHCFAGMSRSAAIAKWLSDNMGFKLYYHSHRCALQTEKYYNRLVYRVLDKAANKQKDAAFYDSMFNTSNKSK